MKTIDLSDKVNKIQVTSCMNCPLTEKENGLYYCIHPENKEANTVNGKIDWKPLRIDLRKDFYTHLDSCPLKHKPVIVTL